jgi:4-amino-4-deoxy-L-arabinose transferase and related glycosyltransferases of PMT family
MKLTFSVSTIIKATLAILIPLLFSYAMLRRLHNDEFESIHTAWKILFDGEMYKDFFQHHHPVFYYALTPFFKITGATTNIIYVLRLCMFFVFLGIGYATYLLAKTLTNATTGLLSVILLYSLPVFTIRAIEIRPDVPMTFFSTLAITLWVMYLHNKKKLFLTTSALSLGLSCVFVPRPMMLLIFFVAISLWFYQKPTKTEIIQYGAIFCLPPLLGLAYIITTGSFYPYVTYSWIFNFLSAARSSFLYNVIFILATNIPFAIFYGIGLSSTNTNLTPIVLISLCLITDFIAVPCSYLEYLLPTLPFVSIIAATGFYIIITKYKNLLIPIILLTILPPFFTNYLRRVIHSPLTKQVEKINYILSITNKTDLILDDTALNDLEACNLFRKDINFFWYDTNDAIPTYNHLQPYSYNVYKLIEEKHPSIINKSALTHMLPQYIDITRTSILQKYKSSNRYEDLLTLQENLK